jgi:hypothetical protein
MHRSLVERPIWSVAWWSEYVWLVCSGGMKKRWCVSWVYSPEAIQRSGTKGAKQKRSMGMGVQARYCADTGVPRMKAGEAATAMTNWCNHPKGKRGLAIPSKAIMDLSQVLCWFGVDFAKPDAMRPFYRALKLFN